jgi:hypothetical protein
MTPFAFGALPAMVPPVAFTKLYRLKLRRNLAILAAYLVLLHAVGMGAMAAPVHVGSGPVAICSIHGDGASGPASPDHGQAEHAPCALCGLGACAVAPPDAIVVPAPYATASVIAVPSVAHRAAPTRYLDASRPRGPPALG